MNAHPIATANPGFPRMALNRQLKFALERFWAGEWSRAQLDAAARDIRRARWQMQADGGIDRILSNDLSLYDHVLDAAVLVGAAPLRYTDPTNPDPPAACFTMARGSKAAPAMEITKWFDTNYHYIVSEFEPEMEFHVACRKPMEEFLEAKALGLVTRPVLLSPVSLALLGKISGLHRRPAADAEPLAEVYGDLLKQLASAGVVWVQIDEPCLGLDLPLADRELFGHIYERLATSATPELKILIATYFSDLSEDLELALRLPVAELHLDLVSGPGQLPVALENAPAGMVLSLGVVDGRNIWRADLDSALEKIRRAADRLGPHPNRDCAFLFSGAHPCRRGPRAPTRCETGELSGIRPAKAERGPVPGACGRRRLSRNRGAVGREPWHTRRPPPQRPCLRSRVRERVAGIAPQMFERSSRFSSRRSEQALAVPLPLLPAATIGSFPQTPYIRRARAAHRSGKLSGPEYESLLRTAIEGVIRFKEEIGLDVFVHGEFERSDMVEYFGEQLDGFAFTGNGWVQSYRSRCVKPPILFGDLPRPRPMTLARAQSAQSLTKGPVKGMLTAPVTRLESSFVRDDLPRADICFQVALALRDEVRNLEETGIRVTQVDEPALREGLPLGQVDRAAHLLWSVDAFRLATSVASDETQIHTYVLRGFDEVLDAVVRMDADVISMEAARSRSELLATFTGCRYPNDVGRGVDDIHSPRVPGVEETEPLIRKALDEFRPEQLWVNPDYGLKTRRWEEVRPALVDMVAAPRRVRETGLPQRGADPGRRITGGK